MPETPKNGSRVPQYSALSVGEPDFHIAEVPSSNLGAPTTKFCRGKKGPTMRIFPLLALLALLPVFAPGAIAADALKVLASANSLNCVFKSAIVTNWEAGSYQSRPRKGFSFPIDAINTARGNAKAVAPGGASHLEMIALPNVRHFLGFTENGDLNTTSVHGQFGAKDGDLLASHSVHMASEPPQTFQNFGICTAKK